MTGGNADPLERRRLIQDIERLTEEIERLTEENGRLREENRRQKDELSYSTAIREHCDMEFNQLKQENTYLRRQVEHLNAQIRELQEEFEKRTQELQALRQEMEDLKQQHKQTLKWLFQKNKRRVCNNDCVSCVIAMICENNKLGLGVKFCCPQLRTIISLHAGPKFEPKHIKCAEFMDLLKKCGIVEQYYDYEYPPEMLSRENEMAKAFNKLMTMDPSLRVVIIGRVISKANNHGHAELCYLNTRTQDGKVKIHDPQTETWGEGGLQDFIDHVKNDEGVILYTVIIGELKQIHDKYLSFFHLNTSDQTLATATGDIDGEC